jgi:hypothetical protein
MLAWTCFINEFQFWDLMIVLASNYPNDPKGDVEWADKKRAYFVMLSALTRLLCFVPTMCSIGPYIDPTELSPSDVSSRANFCEWVSRRRIDWAVDRGKTPSEIECMRFSEINFKYSLS